MGCVSVEGLISPLHKHIEVTTMSRTKLLAQSKQQKQALVSYNNDGDINPIISILREIKGNLYYQGGFGFLKEVLKLDQPVLNQYINSLPDYYMNALHLHSLVNSDFFKFTIAINYDELVSSLPSEDTGKAERCVVPARWKLFEEAFNPPYSFVFDLILETPDYRGSGYLTGFIGNHTNLPGVDMGTLTPYLRISKRGEVLLEVKLPAISWKHSNPRHIFDPSFPVLPGRFQYERTALINKYLHKFVDPNPPKKQKYQIQTTTTEWNPELAKFVTF